MIRLEKKEEEKMSQDNTIFISGMEQMLKGHGFEDVHIEAVLYPQYFIDHERKELAEVGLLMTEEALKNTAPQYYRVTTKQGVFGMIMGEYPLVDLTGTGIPLSEFIPEEDVADLPPDIPPCIGFEDSEQFLLLWQLLTKKKARVEPPSAEEVVKNSSLDDICEIQRDAFIAFVERGEDVNNFVSHLVECEKCRVAVEKMFEKTKEAFERLAEDLRKQR